MYVTITLGLSVDLKEKLPSLQNCCLIYVLFHLEEFPIAYLALLPTAMRTQLMLHLPIADIFRLEGTAVINGVEIEKIRSTVSGTLGARNIFIKEQQNYFETVLSLLVDFNASSSSRWQNDHAVGRKLFGIRNWNPYHTEYIVPPRYRSKCYAFGSATEVSNFFGHFLSDSVRCLELSCSETPSIIWLIQFAPKLEKLKLEHFDDGIQQLSPELCSSLCNVVARPCFQSLKMCREDEGSDDEAEPVHEAPLTGDFIRAGFMITLNKLTELLVTFSPHRVTISSSFT